MEKPIKNEFAKWIQNEFKTNANQNTFETSSKWVQNEFQNESKNEIKNEITNEVKHGIKNGIGNGVENVIKKQNKSNGQMDQTDKNRLHTGQKQIHSKRVHK